MAEAPRRLGTPLDAASASDRAHQVAALTDPLRLRVLSAIAVSEDGQRHARDIAASLGASAETVGTAMEALAGVDLVQRDRDGSWQLTASAWVRFGRLLGAEPAVPARPGRVVTSPMVVADPPPVAARIAADLAYRFSAAFSPETVARYVAESYLLLAERARIERHLPSLTARFATDRLAALATAEGIVLRGTPEVLFVCVRNAGRSQMAAAILRHLAGDRVHVRTAGSRPAAAVDAVVVEALDEIGVPIASEFPKPLTDEVVKAADFVVTMGCGDACPIYPGRRYLDWAIDDPVGRTIQQVRVIREDILERVNGLIEEMDLARTAPLSRTDR